MFFGISKSTLCVYPSAYLMRRRRRRHEFRATPLLLFPQQSMLNLTRSEKTGLRCLPHLAVLQRRPRDLLKFAKIFSIHPVDISNERLANASTRPRTLFSHPANRIRYNGLLEWLFLEACRLFRRVSRRLFCRYRRWARASRAEPHPGAAS